MCSSDLPIEQMAENLSEPGTQAAYKELVPFMNKIRQQHEDILKSSQVRQEFTANVSHELKTPLTAISGYAELIEHGMSGENTERFASEIHKNAARLQILSRRTKNNPILIGEPGTGKTAIVEGLAHRILRGDVPENLKNKQVYSLDMEIGRAHV